MGDVFDKLAELSALAVDICGEEAQLGQVQEEAGEVIAAINHLKRGRIDHLRLAGEFADLFIVGTQLALILVRHVGVDGVAKAVDEKMSRLEKRLDVEKAKADLERHARP